MNVDGSALAASALIRALISDSEVSLDLEDRLFQLGVDADWLEALADRYYAYWHQTFNHYEDGATATVDEHALLLMSWLTAELRGPEQNVRLNSDAFARATAIYSEATGVGILPPIERLTLTVGVVGRPVPIIDRDFPVWFPKGILEPSVELAYQGLVEHVASAPESDWPEVYRTSVLWRLGGIAQGLIGGEEQLLECMKSLNKVLASSLPLAYRPLTGDDWLTEYRKNRNVFTHVRPEANLTFNQALGAHDDTRQLIDYIRLATYYVAIELNQRISSFQPEQVQRWVDVVDNDQAWVGAGV